MKVNGYQEKGMEMENSNGLMVHVMKDNGKMTKVVGGEN